MESMGEQPVSSKTFIAVFQIMQKSKIRVSRQIDFTRSKQSGSSSREKTCMRWILIHLNSEFHAMRVKSTTPCDGNINIIFSYFIPHAYRKVYYHGLTQ